VPRTIDESIGSGRGSSGRLGDLGAERFDEAALEAEHTCISVDDILPFV
jgi:hypothetical protein